MIPCLLNDYFFYLVTTDDVACEFSDVLNWLCGWTDVSEGPYHWAPASTGYTGISTGKVYIKIAREVLARDIVVELLEYIDLLWLNL